MKFCIYQINLDRDTDRVAFEGLENLQRYGVPELFACTLIVILQLLRKNMYLSIIAGTACYMVLIRVV